LRVSRVLDSEFCKRRKDVKCANGSLWWV